MVYRREADNTNLIYRHGLQLQTSQLSRFGCDIDSIFSGYGEYTIYGRETHDFSIGLTTACSSHHKA